MVSASIETRDIFLGRLPYQQMKQVEPVTDGAQEDDRPQRQHATDEGLLMQQHEGHDPEAAKRNQRIADGVEREAVLLSAEALDRHGSEQQRGEAHHPGRGPLLQVRGCPGIFHCQRQQTPGRKPVQPEDGQVINWLKAVKEQGGDSAQNRLNAENRDGQPGQIPALQEAHRKRPEQVAFFHRERPENDQRAASQRVRGE